MTCAPGATRIRLLISTDRSRFPAVTIKPVFNDAHPEDQAAAVDVPLPLWQAYQDAQNQLTRAEGAIVDLAIRLEQIRTALTAPADTPA